MKEKISFIFNKIKDNKMVILYLFLIFPFFKPPYFEVLNIVDKIYQICFVISSCVIYYLCIKKKYLPKFSLLTLLLAGILVLSSFINNVLNISTIKIAVELFTITLLTNYCIKYNLKEFLNA